MNNEQLRADVSRAINDDPKSEYAELLNRCYVALGEQQSVQDVSAMARVLANRIADVCNVDREDNWKIYGQDYIDDVKAMLYAAPVPAQPAVVMPPSPYRPELRKEMLTDYEIGELQGRCDMWEEVARLNWSET